MFQSLKKEVAANAGLPGSGIDLYLSYDKKFIDLWKKMVDAKAQSIKKMMKWAMQEDCKVLQAMFTRIAGLESLWVTLQRHCISQYEAQKVNFKDVIEGEKTLDIKRIEAKTLETKVNKLLQKIENKKSNDKRETTLQQLMLDQEKHTDEYFILLDNHNVFKMSKFQKIVSSRTETFKRSYSDCLKLCDSQKEIVDIFLSGNLSNLDPTSISHDKIHLSACVVTSVSQAIGLGNISQGSFIGDNYQAKQQWLEEIGAEEENDVYGTLVRDLDAVFASAIYNPIPEDDQNQSGGSTPASDRNYDRISSHTSLGKTTSLQSNLTNSTSEDGDYSYVDDHEYSVVDNDSDEEYTQDTPTREPLHKNYNTDTDYENVEPPAKPAPRRSVKRTESDYLNICEDEPPQLMPKPKTDMPEQKSERRTLVSEMAKKYDNSIIKPARRK
ncbi:DgyrCDS2239 [Dimorphilus gyrociliatus]|uniref:DgyrCDS2239 n=1 Tax=Dimorphilus gyrociliatus TaxID=2664684 RepID=A0A7I8VCQ8_9ANNE|nr:DgyrCDS2239 [Dimorphilus gyrociliatus]